jgi:hypothetical protein
MPEMYTIATKPSSLSPFPCRTMKKMDLEVYMRRMKSGRKTLPVRMGCPSGPQWKCLEPQTKTQSRKTRLPTHRGPQLKNCSPKCRAAFCTGCDQSNGGVGVHGAPCSNRSGSPKQGTNERCRCPSVKCTYLYFYKQVQKGARWWASSSLSYLHRGLAGRSLIKSKDTMS